MNTIGYLTLGECNIIGGETATLQWTLKDSSGNNYDATSWTGKFNIAKMEPNTESVLEKTVTFSSVSSVRCVVSVTLSPSETKDLVGNYIYQLTLLDSSSQATIYQGALNISQNVS